MILVCARARLKNALVFFGVSCRARSWLVQAVARARHPKSLLVGLGQRCLVAGWPHGVSWVAWLVRAGGMRHA
jgi:hypothetical protein